MPALRASARFVRSLLPIVFSSFLTLLGVNSSEAAIQAGVTPGEFSVGQSGSADYRIPIVVPPGTGGMQPALHFSYESGVGDGLLGYGWTLGGLSAITRCPANKALDGFVGGVRYDANDRFCIDGQRLVAVSGAYGANNTIYRTEIDGFTKVQSFGVAGSGPQWFKVWTKSGQVLEFGNDTSGNSRIEAQGQTSIRLWAVNKISDTVGNYLTVSYLEDTANGTYRPSQIDYTGNASASLVPNTSVKFSYELRSDQRTLYGAGSVVKNTYRMTHVMAYVGATLVRDYVVSYDNLGAGGRSRATQVQECGANSVCNPPITFQWQANNAAAPAVPWNYSNNPIPGWVNFADSRVFPGDYDGDGRSDFIVTNPAFTTLPVFHSKGDGTWGWSNNPIAGWVNASDSKLVPGDFNGDGRSDFAVTNPSFTTLPVFLSNGDGTWTSSNNTVPGWVNSNASKLLTGDFNGDGRSDFIVVNPSFTTLPVFLSNGDGTWTWSNNTIAGWVNASNSKVELGDFDGDGLTDFIVSNPAFTTLPLFRSNGDGTWTLTQEIVQGWVNAADSERLIGDFNGDGLNDFVVSNPAFTTLPMFLAKGNGTWAFSNPTIQGWVHATSASRLAGDFNGDGLTDFMVSDPSFTTLPQFVANGDGTWSFSNPTVPGWVNPEKSRIYTGDHTGDGNSDFIIANSGFSTLPVFVSTFKKDLITLVTGSLGDQATITYKPLVDTSVYTKGTGATYPTVDYQGPAYVVSRVDVTNGIGGTRGTTYSYTGARQSVDGRGFLGFASMTASDLATGLKTTTTYNQTFPTIGMVTRTEQRVTATNQLLSETTNTPASLDTVTGLTTVKFPYVFQSVSKNYELNGGALVATTTTTNNYDPFGNPTSIITQVVGGGETFTTTTTNTYTNTEAAWLLGRLTVATVMQEMTNPPTAAEASQTRTSKWQYNPTNGLMTREVVEPGADFACQAGETLCLQTDYGYDAFGNKQTVTVSGNAITTRTTTTNFDTRGQFPKETINALNHKETYNYDARFGVISNQTGPNGLLTSWTYDDFGRQLTESRPDGTSTTITRGFCDANNPCPANGKLWMQTVSTGSALVKVFSDSLGRELRTQTTGFNGTLINTDTEYDAKGLIARKSRPYFSGGTVFWTSFSYDTVGRPTQEVCPQPTGNITCVTNSYNGLTTVATDANSKSTTKVVNVRGETVSIRDAITTAPAWSLTYRYDPFGNLRFTTDRAGNIIENRYDLRGRKTYMKDPDMGIWNYTYNVLGELTKQVSPKQAAAAQSTDFIYDVLGRMTQRTEPEGISTWEYDTAPRGTGTFWLGKLRKETGHAGDIRTTSYDSLGRVSTVALAFNGSTDTTTTAYDTASRPEVLTYPGGGGFATRNVYNANGYVAEVRKADASNALLWRADVMNAEGQVTQSTLGSGVVTTTGFEPSTGRVKTIQTVQSATSIQNLSFKFDPVGNLQERQDVRQAKTETFGYDSLYRLTTSQVTGQAVKTNTYDTQGLGNIATKDGVGTYTYGTGITTTAGSAGPHAVVATTTGTKTYRYDANGNMTQELTAGATSKSMSYSSYDAVIGLVGTGSPAPTINFVYGSDRSRIQQTHSLNGVTAYFYAGSTILMERLVKATTTTSTHYIYAGGQNIGVFIKKTGASDETRYFHRDHLGSVDTVTSATGTVIERMSYDSWGKRRNADWTDAAGTITVLSTVRGFTGHEMLDSLGLIHMNGRVYNPTLGRFISADPFIQFAENLQSYNRYSYVLNNPLSYTDPSGYFLGGLFKAIKKLFKAVTRIVSSILKILPGPLRTIAAIAVNFIPGIGTYTAGFVSGLIASGGDLKAGIIGALTAGAFSSIGHGFIGDALGITGKTLSGGQYLLKAVAHGVVGGVASVAQGGNFLSGFLSGGVAQFLSGPINGLDSSCVVGLCVSPVRVIASAVAGGVSSVLGGGKFANGAMTGAFGRLFNEEAIRRPVGRLFGANPYDIDVNSVTTRAPNADDPVEVYGRMDLNVTVKFGLKVACSCEGTGVWYPPNAHQITFDTSVPLIATPFDELPAIGQLRRYVFANAVLPKAVAIAETGAQINRYVNEYGNKYGMPIATGMCIASRSSCPP